MPAHPDDPLDLPSLLPDLLPIPQDDGPRPLAQISYSDAYVDAMGYLRALMARNELSERTLQVTAYVIGMNPAHYTCWGARLLSIFEVARKAGGGGKGGETEVLRREIEFLDGVAVRYEKNYQIWHHRQLVMERIGEVVLGTVGEVGGVVAQVDVQLVKEIVDHEQAFMEKMFLLDSKNYHVWSYRQWLVRRFGLFPSFDSEVEVEAVGGSTTATATSTTTTTSDSTTPVTTTTLTLPQLLRTLSTKEMDSINTLLAQDVRNNSAWNHRHFLLFGNPNPTKTILNYPGEVDKEVEFVKSSIFIAPQNASAWMYLLGVYEKLRKRFGEGYGLEGLQPFLLSFVEFGKEGEGKEEVVVSSHALEVLADVWAEKARKGGDGDAEAEEGRRLAVKAWGLLADKYDPVRKNYWVWKRREMEKALGVEVGA